MQRTPAGLPAGKPGTALDIDGAMQQAPHPGRHFTLVLVRASATRAAAGRGQRAGAFLAGPPVTG